MRQHYPGSFLLVATGLQWLPFFAMKRGTLCNRLTKKLTKRLREVGRNDCLALGAPCMSLWRPIVRNARKPWL